MELVNDDSGNVGVRYECGPFTESLGIIDTLTVSTPFRFNAKYTDPETGLIYYGYRCYSPSLGRRLSWEAGKETGEYICITLPENSPIIHLNFLDWKCCVRIWNWEPFLENQHKGLKCDNGAYVKLQRCIHGKSRAFTSEMQLVVEHGEQMQILHVNRLP